MLDVEEAWSIMLLCEHGKRNQRCIIARCPLKESRKGPHVSTCGPCVMSPSEAASTALRHPVTGVKTMLCGLEPLSHLLKRCGINLSARIPLA